MKKLSILLFTILVSVTFVIAVQSDFISSNTHSNGKASLIIPEHAVQLAPGVFSLGTAKDTDGRIVEGYAFVKYKKGYHHRAGHGGGPANGGDTGACFAYLSEGAKWRTLENYIVDPNNNVGLAHQFVRDNIASDISEWEDAADGSIDEIQGANILGNEVVGVVDGADTSSPDNKNEVLFADIADSGAIGVTIVWGIFRGPPFQRGLVEWDQVYDDVDFEWSEDCTIDNCTAKMDFWNIAIHEIGHATGMAHPSDSCTEETMYRFADFVETKKRDLNSGDIAGINGLY